MLKAIDVNQRIEFVSSFDTNEPKTVIVLKPLSGLDLIDLADGKKDDIKVMIQKSIVEIRNYDKTDINDVVGSLSLNVIGELLNKINEINNLTRQDTKN